MIRLFKLADLDKVCDIELRSFPQPWSKFLFRFLHYRNPGGFIVATKGGEVVGYAIAGLKRSLKFRERQLRRRGHLLNLAVDPEFRRQGIGKALVKSIIAYLREKEVEDVSLEVRASNRAAREMYSGLGFREDRIIKGYYPNGEDAIVMTREL